LGVVFKVLRRKEGGRRERIPKAIRRVMAKTKGTEKKFTGSLKGGMGNAPTPTSGTSRSAAFTVL